MELNDEDREVIRRMAYFKWLDAGCPQGDGCQYWLDAEFDYLHSAGRESSSDTERSGQRPSGRQRSGGTIRRPDKEELIGSRGYRDTD